jgi:hypothetical protein
MLRSVIKPPLFYIKEKAEFELDHVDLPVFDVSLCSGLTACDIDLSKSVFRARIYTFEGCAAFLALSIHHVSSVGSERLMLTLPGTPLTFSLPCVLPGCS